MDTYDYSNNSISELAGVMDKLTRKEVKQVLAAVETIKLQQAEDNRKTRNAWFDAGILPVLKEFAEMSGSVLIVEREQEVIAATFKNGIGFDFFLRGYAELSL